MNLAKHWAKETRYPRTYIVWIHLYGVQKQAKLIYSVRNQDSGFLCTVYWLEMCDSQREGGLAKLFLVLSVAYTCVQVVKIQHALCLWDEHFSVTILYSVIAFAALLMWGSREIKWAWPLGFWMMPLIFIQGRVGGEQIWGRGEGTNQKFSWGHVEFKTLCRGSLRPPSSSIIF